MLTELLSLPKIIKREKKKEKKTLGSDIQSV